MAGRQMGSRIKIRRDVNANLSAVNPVLEDGELIYTKDTRVLKVGDGVKDWVHLPRLVFDSEGANGVRLVKRVYGNTFERDWSEVVVGANSWVHGLVDSNGVGVYPDGYEIYYHVKNGVSAGYRLQVTDGSNNAFNTVLFNKVNCVFVRGGSNMH
jgi:hypothetical protein